MFTLSPNGTQTTRERMASAIVSHKPNKATLTQAKQATIALYDAITNGTASATQVEQFAKHIRKRVYRSIRSGYVIGMGNRPYMIPESAIDYADDIAQDILAEYLTKAKQGVQVAFGRAFQSSARKLCNRATGYWSVRLAEYNPNTGRYVLLAPDAKLPSVAQRRIDNADAELSGQPPKWVEYRHDVQRWDDAPAIAVKPGTEWLDQTQSEHTVRYALEQASNSHPEGYAIVRSILANMDYRTIARVCGVSFRQVRKVWEVYTNTIAAANELRSNHRSNN